MNKVLPLFRNMIWGNWEINELFGISSELPVGEIWLVSGYPTFENKLADGRTINEFGHSLYGDKYPRFPILIKVVSSNQWLSVQVHPDDDFAKNIENEPWGKNEIWYFLTDGEFAICEHIDNLKSVLKSAPNKVPDIMTFVKVKKGSIVHLPAGTVHALGPNTTVIEVQQSSDLTYRIYDWGRNREIHIEKALKAAKNTVLSDIFFKDSQKLSNNYFTVQISSIKKLFVENASPPFISVPLSINKEFCASIIDNVSWVEQSENDINFYVYNFC